MVVLVVDITIEEMILLIKKATTDLLHLLVINTF